MFKDIEITALFFAVLGQTMFIYKIRWLPTIPLEPFVACAPSARFAWPWKCVPAIYKNFRSIMESRMGFLPLC